MALDFENSNPGQLTANKYIPLVDEGDPQNPVPEKFRLQEFEAIGKAFRNGEGAPSAGLGSDGDFYIDTANNDLYGPKTGGAWGSGISLIGPQGPQGTQGDPGPQGDPGADGSDGADGVDGKTIHNGSGAPAGGLGVDGDFYIDTSNDEIYGPKTAGAWGSGTSLVGPQGPQGPSGSGGADWTIISSATADGTTDDSAVFNTEQGTSNTEKKKYQLLPGTIRLPGVANASYGVSFFAIISSIIGTIKEAVNLLYETVSGDNRGFFIGSAGSVQRLERLDETETDSVDQPRVAIQNQVAGLNFFTCVTAADAAEFPAGRLLRLGCRHIVTDADDKLFERILTAMVISFDDTTGVVMLDREIPFALEAGVFDGTVYPDYAPGSFTQGDKVYHEFAAGQPVLFEALDTGTAVAASPDLDGTISSVTGTPTGTGYDNTAIARAYQDGKDLGQEFTVTTSAGAITDVVPSGTAVPGYNSTAVIQVYQPGGGGSGAVLTPVISGIRFKKRSNSIGALPKTMNYSPVAQLLLDEENHDLTISNLTLLPAVNNEDATVELINSAAVRAAYRVTLEDITIKGTNAFAFAVNEGATDVTLRRIKDEREEHTTVQGGAASFSRGVSCYMAQNLVIEDSTLIAGKGTESKVIFLEAHSSLYLRTSSLICRNATANNAYGILSEGGSLSLVNSKIVARYPVRYNTAAYAGFLPIHKDPTGPRRTRIIESRGNHFIMSAKAFRTTGADNRKIYNASNYYTLFETYQSGNIVQPTTVNFEPYVLTRIYEYIYPHASDNSDWKDFGPIVMSDHGEIDLRDHNFIVFGQTAYYSEPENARIRVRLRTFNDPDFRFLFSTSSNNNDIFVSDEQTQSSLFEGDGGGIRYVHTHKGDVEKLQYQTFLNGDPGGVMVIGLDVLVQKP